MSLNKELKALRGTIQAYCECSTRREEVEEENASLKRKLLNKDAKLCDQKAEIRDQKAEIRDQKAEICDKEEEIKALKIELFKLNECLNAAEVREVGFVWIRCI